VLCLCAVCAAGVYETPGGTILLTARRAMESITLDRAEMHMKVGGLVMGWKLGMMCSASSSRQGGKGRDLGVEHQGAPLQHGWAACAVLVC
jgi:hypothetical protein